MKNNKRFIGEIFRVLPVLVAFWIVSIVSVNAEEKKPVPFDEFYKALSQAEQDYQTKLGGFFVKFSLSRYDLVDHAGTKSLEKVTTMPGSAIADKERYMEWLENMPAINIGLKGERTTSYNHNEAYAFYDKQQRDLSANKKSNGEMNYQGGVSGISKKYMRMHSIFQFLNPGGEDSFAEFLMKKRDAVSIEENASISTVTLSLGERGVVVYTLDRKKNFHVTSTRMCSQQDKENCMQEGRYTYREVKPGLWFVQSGEFVWYGQNKQVRERLVLEPIAAAKLEVGKTYDDAAFRLEFPVGAFVLDHTNGKSYKVTDKGNVEQSVRATLDTPAKQ
jgi:hypothetical protein